MTPRLVSKDRPCLLIESGHSVLIEEEHELELFQWLETKPQLWNKDRKFINFPKAEKLKLWQEVAEQHNKTGQFL